ncbi:guanylate cyclase soluble subunit beta-1-like [Gigantopelta aegis]|uniref:guanylate cyclase soluble subunit beta-1-like n=1 Tax=Gigantopelta aegis TaxID=1735272 RepID=UPI001B888ED3|nr:guanylate cyclase soluble subunit beta-1-like [Gigantopelta aegis]
MTMLQVGSSLAWIIPGWNQSEKCLTSFFALERPRMRLTFTNILSHINTIFILRLTTHSQVNLAYPTTTNDPMRLRGQMIYLPESNCMLFLCSPRVSSIHDLDQRGLYLSDIPVHDATRGLLMMSQTAQSEFHHVVQLEEVIGKLDIAQRSLEEEKGRMRDLLHQMLPVSIADSLMAGKMIEAERFDNVTILFSDIVGFTSICGKCEPIQIVSMLNKLYTMFDQVIGTNRVYKVETIGDAYMVVGGLPEKNPVHAECVANQALDMMYYCKQVVRPDSDEPIQMRIGIHSGEVVAGIVGRRMPRYCLFGNAVNIASRTESNGEPGKIQVTETTYKLSMAFIWAVMSTGQFLGHIPDHMEDRGQSGNDELNDEDDGILEE